MSAFFTVVGPRSRSHTWSPTTSMISTSAQNFRWHPLPNELKQRVIYFAGSPEEENPPGAPVQLGLVSKTWRELTLRTPALWTNMVISLDDEHNRPYHLLPRARRPDLWSRVQNACLWLKRAGALPTMLDVVLFRPETIRLANGLYEVLFEYLLMPLVAQHLGYLRLSIHPNVFPVLFRALGQTEGGYPALRRLHLVTPNLNSMDRPNVGPINPNDLVVTSTNLFPSLTHLGLSDGSNSMNALLLHTSFLLPLHQLTFLAFKSVHKPERYWNDVLNFLEPCQRLVQLGFCFPAWENDDFQLATNSVAHSRKPVVLSSVQALAIEVVRLLEDHIDLEGTETGIIYNVNPIFQTLTLPSLLLLRVFNTMHKRWISCPADSISECARRSSFELDCLLVDGVKWEPTKLLEFLQYSTKLGVLSLIECDLDYGTVLRAMKRVGESDTEENQPLLPNLETLEFLANWNDEQLPVQNNHSNLRVTPEEIVDTLESRWDRDRHHGADHISPRLKAVHLILPPPLDTFDLYSQKSMDTVARLREEGMKLTLTVEEHAMLQDDDLGWSM